MAAVCGSHYALNYASNANKSKTFVFVKLTDSALKAIEDYLSGTGDGTSKPSIQFESESNQGTISLPTHGAGSEKRFGFNTTSMDSDAPQGSFECIQEGGSERGGWKSLGGMQCLGNLNYKMQIHASEDSYQKTKVRMKIADQEKKNNCTKVIKESGPIVGRKVKLKGGRPFERNNLPQIAAYRSINNYQTKISNSSFNKLNGGCITGNMKLAGGSGSLQIGNNNCNTSKSLSGASSVNSDVMKKTLRERVIHLLAVRPYKKPELLARLMKDGIRERDKKGLSPILTQVALLKDNAYQLGKHGWHDVQVEDWPFYSPDERETVSRRNPLFLMLPSNPTHHDHQLSSNLSSINSTLSPLSSDSNSLQDSPSPPSAVNSNNSPSRIGSKRLIEHSNLVNKKQRISHVPNGAISNRVSHYEKHKKSSPLSNISQTSGYDNVINDWAKKPISPKIGNNNSNNVVNNSTSSLPRNSLNISNNLNYNSRLENAIHKPLEVSQSAEQPNEILMINANENHIRNGCTKKIMTQMKSGKTINDLLPSSKIDSYCSTPNSSPDSGTGSNDGSSLSTSSKCSLQNSPPDYTMKYSDITSDDQRMRYKSDFYTDYEEYSNLSKLLGVRQKKFNDLEFRLKRTVEGSDEWNRMMNQIEKEYDNAKKDSKFMEARNRFYYLHDKLLHIKKAVNVYDRLNPKKSSKVKKEKMTVVS